MYGRRTLQGVSDESRRTHWLSSFGVLLSAAVHLVTFAALGSVKVTTPVVRQHHEVQFSVVNEPEPAPELEAEAEPEPEPEPEPPPPPVRRVVKAAAPKPVEKAPETPEPPAAAEETIADFSGTTLTSEGTGGWKSAIGSGAPMNSPIGKAQAVVTGRDRAGVQGGVVGGVGTRVVAESELSRRPTPPNLALREEALRRNYPRSARDQGIEGQARIKLRILATGAVQPLATLSETYPGFADACKASTRGMNWAPGLDRTGQPVATDVTYSCEFAVE